MVRTIFPLIICLLILGCSSPKATPACGLDPKNFPKHGTDSRILEFRRTVQIDTTTASISGKIIPLSTPDTLAYTEIELTGTTNVYKTTSNLLGEFIFSYIPSGDYKVSAHYVGYRTLNGASIHLSPGDAAKLVIGMGTIGQDDLMEK